jgi:hypothetical protein
MSVQRVPLSRMERSACIALALTAFWVTVTLALLTYLPYHRFYCETVYFGAPGILMATPLVLLAGSERVTRIKRFLAGIPVLAGALLVVRNGVLPLSQLCDVEGERDYDFFFLIGSIAYLLLALTLFVRATFPRLKVECPMCIGGIATAGLLLAIPAHAVCRGDAAIEVAFITLPTSPGALILLANAVQSFRESRSGASQGHRR